MANYPDDPAVGTHGVDTTTNRWHPIPNYIKPDETVSASIARVASQNAQDGGFDASGNLSGVNPGVGTQSNQHTFLSATGVDHDSDDLS